MSLVHHGSPTLNTVPGLQQTFCKYLFHEKEYMNVLEPLVGTEELHMRLSACVY